MALQQVGQPSDLTRQKFAVLVGRPIVLSSPGITSGDPREIKRLYVRRANSSVGSLSGRMTQFPGINMLLGQAAAAKEPCDVGAVVGFVLLNLILN